MCLFSQSLVIVLMLLSGWCEAAIRSTPGPTTITTKGSSSTTRSGVQAGVAAGRPTTGPRTTPAPAPAGCPAALNTTSPLGRLRTALRNHTITRHPLLDAYVVFYTDEHLSEEPGPEERRLEYVSGWGGVGVGAVLARGEPAVAGPVAALWLPAPDLQRARRRVDCAWQLYDADNPSNPTPAEWIASRVGSGGQVGGDARLAAMMEWQTLSSQLQRESLQLLHVPLLVDTLWADEPEPRLRRPESSKVVVSQHEFNGVSWREKVGMVRGELRAGGADALVVCALDEVSWLLGLRGRDLPHAPLFRAFVLVAERELHVYAPPGKLNMPIREVLAADDCNHRKSNCTQIHDYNAIYTELRWRAAEWTRVLVPTAGTFQRGANAALVQSVPNTKRLFQPSPIVYLKAQKNSAEVAAMKAAHLKDAVAMCTSLCYIERYVKSMKFDEASVVMKVDAARFTQAGYVSKSMVTRAAFGPSGAEPDYQLPANASRRIGTDSTLIVSSGGQYNEGTTAVTRTMHYGSPTVEERVAYTLTLRALIALSSLRAPGALPAAHADPAGRAPLWAAGRDYPHPTGHGIGAALALREDPVVIDYKQDTNLHTLKERYFITCEPAWYEPNKFGVQLGNVLEVVAVDNGFLAFQETTLVPYEPNLIERKLLTEYEIKWINTYNEHVSDVVGKELKDQGLYDEYYWLTNKTVPLKLPTARRPVPDAATTAALAYGQTFIFMLIFIVNIM